MKKTKSLLLSTLIISGFALIGAHESQAADMHRLYNKNSGEHFYTADTNERNALVNANWIYEGVAWEAPTQGDPVYRLYNKNNGDHHYTMHKAERDYLIKVGWTDEGIGWQSEQSTKDYPILRAYNPNATGAGSHHYTLNKNEMKNLTTHGWKDENIGWYAKSAKTSTTSPNQPSQSFTAENTWKKGAVIEGISQYTLDEVNKLRVEAGQIPAILSTHFGDNEFQKAAELRAKEMGDRDSMYLDPNDPNKAHTRPDGRSYETAYTDHATKKLAVNGDGSISQPERLTRSFYVYGENTWGGLTSENLGSYSSKSELEKGLAVRTIQTYRNSPAHYENLIRNFYSGLPPVIASGYYYNTQGKIYNSFILGIINVSYPGNIENNNSLFEKSTEYAIITADLSSGEIVDVLPISEEEIHDLVDNVE